MGQQVLCGNRVIRAQTHTAAQKLPVNYEAQVAEFQSRLAYAVYKLKTPPALVVNWDQTGLHLVPSGSVTRAVKGSPDVPMLGGRIRGR